MPLTEFIGEMAEETFKEAASDSMESFKEDNSINTEFCESSFNEDFGI